jgi:alpha-beta hydrolase superfamily lysophospholipase
MKRFLFSAIIRILRALFYGILGAFLAIIFLFVLDLQKRPDLNVWHKADLDAEFTIKSKVNNFQEYLDLEEKLFAQLDDLVYDRIKPEDRSIINRYYKGSMADPDGWSPNWNRTFEMTNDTPKAGVLLLHGLSDSPYSMRSLGQRLHAAGAQVLGLRVPGHGTAPSGLADVHWQDMSAAVRLAMHHLQDEVGDLPLYIVGYSNGGALAVRYALETLDDKTLPTVDRLVLLSPEIGIVRVAALAIWQARLGHLLGLQKLEWTDILPEYEPFKYGSFAVNGGDLSYRLTAVNRSRLTELKNTAKLNNFPPVLAFQSAVDKTVSMKAVVEVLFRQLPQNDHELMLFDINRSRELVMVLKSDPKPYVDSLFKDSGLTFKLSFFTITNDAAPRIVIRSKEAGQSAVNETFPDLKWPRDVYSLAHVALPFPADDPIYGGDVSADSPGLQLGNLALRGERDTLQIPASTMLRIRWNPFYDFMENRLLEFFSLDQD